MRYTVQQQAELDALNRAVRKAKQNEDMFFSIDFHQQEAVWANKAKEASAAVGKYVQEHDSKG